jgi:hypothetical protein
VEGRLTRRSYNAYSTRSYHESHNLSWDGDLISSRESRNLGSKIGRRTNDDRFIDFNKQLCVQSVINRDQSYDERDSDSILSIEP